MSLAEALNAIRGALQEDSALGTRGDCRTTPIELAKIAREVDPQLNVTFLAAKPGDRSLKNHYALELSDGTFDVVVNMDPAQCYPEYIGPKQTAPGLLSQMQPVEEII